MEVIPEKPALPPVKNTSTTGAQPEKPAPIGYQNHWCLLLGVPEEFTEKEVCLSLKAQGLQVPESFEWKEESQINYLKVYFEDPNKALDLILRDIKIGFNPESLVYPIMVLPYMEEMTMTDMLKYHEVQVDSSVDIDTLSLYIHYIKFGDILDILEISPKKHIIIFTKQPKALNVIQMSPISLPQAQLNQEVILTHTMVDRCYSATRKSVNYSLEGLRLKMNNFPLNIPQQFKEEVKKIPQVLPPTNNPQQPHSLVIQTQKSQEGSQPQPPNSNPRVFMTEKYEAKSKDQNKVGINLLAYESRQYDNQNRGGYNDESIEHRSSHLTVIGNDRGGGYKQFSTQKGGKYPNDDKDRNRGRNDYYDKDRRRDNYREGGGYQNYNRNQSGNRDNRNSGNSNQNRNYQTQRR